MITEKELNPHNYLPTKEVESNLKTLLIRMNAVRNLYGKPMVVTSGLRTLIDQARINPSAPQSKHLLGQACDISDRDGELWAWVEKHLDEMAAIGLWFEDGTYTDGWVHFQTVPPKSGKRIFVP